MICTKATLDLCEVMLQDSGHIQEMEAEWQNRKGKRAGKGEAIPLYTMKDAEKCLRYFQTVNYDEIIQLADGVKVRFQDAGHILGSAIIEIWIEEGGQEKKLIFSGDLGNLTNPSFEIHRSLKRVMSFGWNRPMEIGFTNQGKRPFRNC